MKKAIAPIKYRTKEGEEKTAWRTLGRAWVNDDGSVRINIDTMPVGQGWDGTILLKEDDRDQEVGF